MVTLLQLINHVGNGFKDEDFSIEDKPRSGQSKKFEDKKKLEALLEEDQSQRSKRSLQNY